MLYKSNAYVSARKRKYGNIENVDNVENADKKTNDDNNSKSKKKSGDDDDDDDDDEDSDTEVYVMGTSVYYSTSVSTKNTGKLRKALHKATQTAINSNYGLHAPYVSLYIHSCGGDLFAGFSAFSLIRRNVIPVVTIADGYVASAATFMLLAGSYRYIVPSSHVLIHQLSTGGYGKFQEIEDDYKNCKRIMERMHALYKEETWLPPAILKKLLKSELDLTDDKCVKYGIVNELLPTELL